MKAFTLLILMVTMLGVAVLAVSCLDDSDDGTADGDATQDGDATLDGDEESPDGDVDSEDGDADSVDGDADSVDGDSELSGGTWRDESTERIWQNPPAGGAMTWQQAVAYCDDLSRSERVAWRLPTIDELRELIRGCAGTVTGGLCGVTENCLDSTCVEGGDCNACTYQDGPAEGCYRPDEIGGSCLQVWSSSPVGDIDDYVWSVDFTYGSVYYYSVDYTNFVWCVR